ncbi:MAG: hypothetical protein QG656_740, partial [Candidatus Hydrogenedentes bacterium]|nr:hypothetical protein [Candidatus Hydrogenedentota bacterium]
NGTPVAVSPKGMMGYKEGAWRTFEVPLPHAASATGPFPAEPVLANVSSGGTDAIGTATGLYLRNAGGDWRLVLPADARYSWALRDVAALAFDVKGRLWFGAEQGIGYLENGQWRLFTGKEGVPYNRFTCAAAGEDGAMWFGTERGAIRADGERFAYRAGRRWLPGDHINAIAVEANGTAWIATSGGVSRIERRPMTFEEKSAYFTKQVETRHNRMGFIADCELREPFNVDSWQSKISDNDGMYTAMYGAAQSFRYAVTRDPEAKALAKRSFEACKWLVDITGTGFPARVIVPKDWREPVNEQYNEEYNKRSQERDPLWKNILPRFVPSADGQYLWKCDTSSDELSGHYFFYGVYYDLAAETDEEKQAVRDCVTSLTDHLIRNGFLLRDHDGKPTRWGNHSPEYVDSAQGWEQRGLNSMMMLSYLNVACHVTGKPEYADAARKLRDEHHYHINAMQAKMFFPPDYVVPWDNNLCLMSMYGLIKYEEDPELLLLYRLAAENAWLHISKQKNAFWNLLYGAIVQRFRAVAETGVYEHGEVFPELGTYAQFTTAQLKPGGAYLDDALETLRGIPLDLIGYTMENTHRLDVVLDPTPGQSATVGWHFDGRAVPVEERGHVRQDRDGFALNASEDGGRAEHEGTFFLLPYFLGRYHGFIR